MQLDTDSDHDGPARSSSQSQSWPEPAGEGEFDNDYDNDLEPDTICENSGLEVRPQRPREVRQWPAEDLLRVPDVADTVLLEHE